MSRVVATPWSRLNAVAGKWEWQRRWADEELAKNVAADCSDYGGWGTQLRGRLVVHGEGAQFWLVPRFSSMGFSSSPPTYVLALPEDIINWQFPPTPEIAKG